YRLVGNALESQTLARFEALPPLLNASLAGRVFQRDQAEVQAILDQLIASELTEIRYILVLNQNRQVVGRAGDIALEQLPEIDHHISDALRDLVYDTQTELSLLSTTVGSVLFGLDLGNLLQLRNQVLQQSLLIAGAEILLSLLLLASGGYLLTRHITTLLQATQRVARGEYKTVIAIDNSDEVGLLADNFNAMAATILSRMEALRQSESRFKAIFDAVGDGIFIHDANDGHLLAVNQRMCEMYRCSQEEALESTMADFSANIEPFTAERGMEIIRETTLLTGARTFEWHSRRFDGELFWVEINLRYSEIGDEQQLIALVRDITDRKKAEVEQKLAATSFESSDSIVITDPQGIILRVNQAVTVMTGYSQEELVGRDPSLFQTGGSDDLAQPQRWRQLQEGGLWRGEVQIRHQSGKIFPAWVSVNPVCDERGEISHFVVAATDLSELKAQQRQNEIHAEEERVLGALLRLSLCPLGQEEYLQQGLEQLLRSVPWLSSHEQGGIFLHQKSGAERLTLVAHHNFSPGLCQSCHEIPFGHCLCGRAASEKKLQYANHLDYRHDVHYPGITAHGHYNIPVLVDGVLLGVIVLYLEVGHPYAAAEHAFLERVADVFGMGISRRLAEEEIEYQAYHDPLTTLPNRRLLLERLQQEYALGARLQLYGAVLFIDLDNFKGVNDLHGHPAGDAVLTQVSERLNLRLRSGDTAARLGGDEFVVLLPALGRKVEVAARQAQTVADTLRLELSRGYLHQGLELFCSASIGVVLFPGEERSGEDLLRYADTAMYSAKQAGRNAVHFYQPQMQSAIEKRLTLEQELHSAIARGEFLLYYQPQIALQGGAVVGAEALLRWQHPRRGIVPPDEFIPILDETGMILAVGAWVLDAAAAEVARWWKEELIDDSFVVAVNVSPRQFRDDAFVERLLATIMKY
ncbi:MAG: diguanylate cyclase, partial [Gammaproteobacteria bacterium]|nr:diguanylate cyclase [Gammaproteobacteria bacterium]